MDIFITILILHKMFYCLRKALESLTGEKKKKKTTTVLIMLSLTSSSVFSEPPSPKSVQAGITSAMDTLTH